MDLADRFERAVSGILASGYQSPEEWLIDALGGAKSDSGVRVGYDTAITYAYVYAATQIIASDVASLPLNYYTVETDGDKIIDRRQPSQWVLNGDANEFMSAYTNRETMQSHAMLLGNGYSAIEWDNAGRPRRLILLDPRMTTPRMTAAGLVYELAGRAEPLAAKDVLHVRGLSYDGLVGHSVVSLARNSIGGGLAAEKHGNKFFARGAKPSVVLKTARRLEKDEADNLLENWETRQGGESRPALAHGGLDVVFAPMSNEDSQWLESRKFSRVEIAAWFGLPPHKLGDDSRLSYNSIEAENRAYIGQTLRRWFSRWNSECSKKLVPDPVRRSFAGCIEHDTQPLIDSDMASMADVITKLRASETITTNEGRRMLRLPSVDGGEERTNPNVRPAPAAQPATAPPPSAAGMAASCRRLLVDRITKLLSTEAAMAHRASKQPGFMSWLDGHGAGWTTKLVEALEPVVSVLDAANLNPEGHTAETMAGRLVDASRASLLDAAGRAMPETLTNEVETTTAGWSGRPEAIATWMMGD